MTSRIVLANTNPNIYPLRLGGNVFGWTANNEQSFQLLDAFVELGGNFIYSAHVYSEWAPLTERRAPRLSIFEPSYVTQNKNLFFALVMNALCSAGIERWPVVCG